MGNKTSEKGNFCAEIQPHTKFIVVYHPFVYIWAAAKSYRYVESFHHLIRLLRKKNVATHQVSLGGRKERLGPKF